MGGFPQNPITYWDSESVGSLPPRGPLRACELKRQKCRVRAGGARGRAPRRGGGAASRSRRDPASTARGQHRPQRAGANFGSIRESLPKVVRVFRLTEDLRSDRFVTWRGRASERLRSAPAHARLAGAAMPHAGSVPSPGCSGGSLTHCPGHALSRTARGTGSTSACALHFVALRAGSLFCFSFRGMAAVVGLLALIQRLSSDTSIL